jgi:hypothetical protein
VRKSKDGEAGQEFAFDLGRVDELWTDEIFRFPS